MGYLEVGLGFGVMADLCVVVLCAGVVTLALGLGMKIAFFSLSFCAVA